MGINFYCMRLFHYFLLFAVSFILLVSTLAFVNIEKELPDKHLEVVLRTIGHQLLLHSKDSTSRVLPVTAINEHTFQISFENSFGFTPDTLMNLVHQQLAKTNMPKDYIVSVNDCAENKTVFAYEMNMFGGDLKPCGGRKQKAGCYLIRIEFLAEKPFNYAWLLAAFIPLTFMGFYLNRRQNKRPLKSENASANEGKPPISNNDKTVPEVLECKQFGNFIFDETKGTLRINDATIELSDKEMKALSIFASNQNLVVERDRLRKEIWEDEGVVVINRNVDVLVSKLRKKLSGDPSVQIVNVHGKGYKLMT